MNNLFAGVIASLMEKKNSASKMSLNEEKEEERTQTVTSPEPSWVSMKSSRSITQPPFLNNGPETSNLR